MNFFRYTYSVLILMTLLFAFGSCEKEASSGLSKAVLASTSSLSFEGTGSASQIITVYADADWVTEEVPDWITVSPTSGNGVVDVTLSVTDNMRGGALDNPRRAVVVFRGATLDSRAQVVVNQVGDKFRDVKDYTVGELAALADEAVVSVPNVTVMALTTSGFIVTDAQNANNVYVLGDEAVSIGDKVTLLGEKASNSQSLPIVAADFIDVVSTGGTVTYPTAKDITTEVDTYNATSREYIAVSGILNGSNVSVADANFMVSIVDAPASFNLASMNGHRVVVQGYFDGLAAPVVKVFAAEVQDNGIAKDIYFFEDFEWADSWSVAATAGQTVENDADQAARNVYTYAALAGFVPDLESRGYELICSPSTTTSTYLQRNYLKFGRTDVQAGIVLPPIEIPAGTNFTISFNWAPMVGGTRKFDPVEMVVLITNGTDEVELGPVGHTFEDTVDKLEWLHASFDVSGIDITQETKITIRSKAWDATGFQRWFLDNIEISSVLF